MPMPSSQRFDHGGGHDALIARRRLTLITMKLFLLIAQILASTALTVPTGYKHSQMATKTTHFPIAPEDLITRAQYIVDKEIALGLKDGGACLAEDFRFACPVVGPIDKASMLAALQNFNLEDSWDINQNVFGFHVDPLQPNRVWWLGRTAAKQIAPFAGVDPIDEEVLLAPQVYHMDFNEQGLVTKFGFGTADRLQGTTGGLGGAFGFFYAVGRALPFREAQPFRPSNRYRFFQFVGRMVQKLRRD